MIIIRNIWNILSTAERKGVVFLFGIMIIGMVFELCSVGIVLPALSLITAEKSADGDNQSNLLSFLGEQKIQGQEVIIYIILLIMGLFFVKAVYLPFSAWRKAVFVYKLEAELGKRLFSSYLLKPYTLHLQKNPAELV
jgi:ATP-binding cassette, subfamily B, bacterial PglK